MKTSLHFEAPKDLSIGTVRITGPGDTVSEWVTTPGRRIFEQADLTPGVYSAEIGPTGRSSQSVIFEVVHGQANMVVMPSFSALSSSGGNTSFYDHETGRTLAQVPLSIRERLSADLAGGADVAAGSGPTPSGAVQASRPLQVEVSNDSRLMSIGLSEEQKGPDTFDSFRGQTRMELLSDRLQIELPTDIARNHWEGRRVRLSAAIEGLRVERCLLPLYAGGTRITIVAPAFAAADVEFTVQAIAEETRALDRTLEAGNSAQAIAVRDQLLAGADRAAMLEDGADPWAAILVGLLTIRFPDVFPALSPQWVDRMVERASWAYDAHIVRASHLLAGVAESEPNRVDAVVTKAIGSLARAQVAASPYYRYANQLFDEVASSIEAYIANGDHRLNSAATAKFQRARSRWRREGPLQKGSGSTFTWLARDLEVLKSKQVLSPSRKSSGKLRPRDSKVIFEGRVSAGAIAILAGERRPFEFLKSQFLSAPAAAGTIDDGFNAMPALLRQPGPNDDPNQGRFGGAAARDGFVLSASSQSVQGGELAIFTLVVEAEANAQVGMGDVAWFVLHPTFSPQQMKVAFRGRRARLRLQGWGVFTVGVWLPRQGVELEYNLDGLEDAPRAVLDR